MTEHVVTSKEPAAIGDLVANEFAHGETHVLLHDVPILNHNGGRESAQNPDGYLVHRRLNRDRNMLEICRKLGQFESNSVDPSSFIEINSIVLPPNRPYHTVEASQPDPAKFVSYWGAQPKTSPGEKIKIVSLERLMEWGDEKPERKELLGTLKQPQPLVHEGAVHAPIIDEDQGRIRFDIRATSVENLPEQINSFFSMLMEDEHIADEVTLNAGDALFIDNHRALHAMRPKFNPSRLLYRILLYDRLLGGENYVSGHVCSGSECASDHIQEEWSTAFQGRQFLEIPKRKLTIFEPKEGVDYEESKIAG